ncbi:MAG: pilus assembly protein [Proteobacteria bacterium]|nr:pilus assembly protein [Pseudomonadota bacterium]
MSTFKANNRIGRNRRQTGQGMVEYIIIVGLVAIGAVGVYSAFGRTVQSQMAAITNGLAGQGSQAQAAVKQAGTEAGVATTDAGTALGLDTYSNNVKDQEAQRTG